MGLAPVIDLSGECDQRITEARGQQKRRLKNKNASAESICARVNLTGPINYFQT
jgi:hypothetical protein